MTTYTTTDGDMLDEIAARHYGDTKPDLVVALLLANPAAAEYGPVLPAGVTLTLPDLAPQSANGAALSLWD